MGHGFHGYVSHNQMVQKPRFPSKKQTSLFSFQATIRHFGIPGLMMSWCQAQRFSGMQKKTPLKFQRYFCDKKPPRFNKHDLGIYHLK